jgi:hypothetical protein
MRRDLTAEGHRCVELGEVTRLDRELQAGDARAPGGPTTGLANKDASPCWACTIAGPSARQLIWLNALGCVNTERSTTRVDLGA